MLAIVGLLLPVFAWARAGESRPGLSESERDLVAAVERRASDFEPLLKRAVDIPSATQNLEGVRRVGALIGEELEQLGFLVRWVEVPADQHRAGHLVADHPGTQGKRVLLIGHLDTVLEGHPYERSGTVARGDGVVDMKGGDVLIIQALKALNDIGALEDRRITVVMTGDEEDAGMPLSSSRAALREAAADCDVALAFEAGSGDTATIGRRGVASWRLEVRGKTGHSSGVLSPSAGAGAVFEAARILEAFRRELPEPGLTLHPSLILGGTTVDYDRRANRGSAGGKTNVIAGRAVVEGDLRFLSQEQEEKAVAAMRRIVGENLPRTTAELTVIDEYPAMAPTEANRALLAEYSRASEDLGLGAIHPFDPTKRGAGDISFVSPPLPGLDGLGPRGSGAHSPDERVDLDSFVPQTLRAALLIDRLTR